MWGTASTAASVGVLAENTAGGTALKVSGTAATKVAWFVVN